MTLEAFRAEVLRHLPALASWQFSDRREGKPGVLLNAYHPASGHRVWLEESLSGDHWHIVAPSLANVVARTLPGAIAKWRERNADELAAIRALTVDP